MSYKRPYQILTPAIAAAAYLIFSPAQAYGEARGGYFVPEGEFAPTEEKAGETETKRSVSKTQKGTGAIRTSSVMRAEDEEETPAGAVKRVADDFRNDQQDDRIEALDSAVNDLKEENKKARKDINRAINETGLNTDKIGYLNTKYDALDAKVEQISQRKTLGLRLGGSIGPTFIDGTIYGTLAGRIGVTLPSLAGKLHLRDIFLEGEVGKLFGNYDTDVKTTRTDETETSTVGPAHQQRDTTLEELTKKDTYKLYELLRVGVEFPLKPVYLDGFVGELALQLGAYHGEQTPSLRRESTTQLLDQNGTPLEDPVTVTEDTPNPLVATGKDLDSLAVGASLAVKREVTTVGQAIIRAVLRGEYGRLVVSNNGKEGNNYRATLGAEVNY